MTNEEELRVKFLKDNKFPIAMVEEPYFSYYLDLYEDYLGTRTSFDNFVKDVLDVGGIESYNRLFWNFVDSVIDSVKSKEGYSSLVEFEIPKVRKTLSMMDVRKKFYNNGNAGNKKWISIDMEKANFSSLKSLDSSLVDNSINYEGWVSKFEYGNLFKDYKSVRQIIFGNLNPKRQQVLQRIYMDIFLDSLSENVDLNGLKVFVLGADEIVFEYCDELDLFLDKVLLEFNSDSEHFYCMRKSVFDMSKIGVSKDLGYLKTYDNGIKEMVCVSKNFYAQSFKKVFGGDLNEKDLTFKYEGRLCRMLESVN